MRNILDILLVDMLAVALLWEADEMDALRKVGSIRHDS